MVGGENPPRWLLRQFKRGDWWRFYHFHTKVALIAFCGFKTPTLWHCDHVRMGGSGVDRNVY
jgi:hypothetical protein